MRHLFLAIVEALVLAACATHPSAADAGRARCPSTAPRSGDACAADVGLACVYEHCATEGVVSASCTSGDGGAGTWRVSVTACGATCNGSPCAAGTVCGERASGALITTCMSRGCGDGPLDCECACGAGTPCTIYTNAQTNGAVFACMVGCGASVCP